MSLVLDTSVTLAWLHSDERSADIESVFDRVVASSAWVPGLWRLEVANALTMGVRSKRITAEFRQQSLADLALLDIATDVDTDAMAWTRTVRLADQHRLTVYDAAYLELAQRLVLPLATLDAALRRAATSLSLPLLGHAAD